MSEDDVDLETCRSMQQEEFEVLEVSDCGNVAFCR